MRRKDVKGALSFCSDLEEERDQDFCHFKRSRRRSRRQQPPAAAAAAAAAAHKTQFFQRDLLTIFSSSADKEGGQKIDVAKEGGGGEKFEPAGHPPTRVEFPIFCEAK